jgi:hypothetical protein
VASGEREEAKRLRLRYAGVCRVCGRDLAAQTRAIYERPTGTVKCLDCPPDKAVEVGDELAPERRTGGGSAPREAERRHRSREERIRSDHPRLGGLLLALFDDPQSTRAWAQGAVGEERVGARLDALASSGVVALHDRRMPDSRANIDHLAVTSTGAWVIDATRYRGQRPRLKVEGGIFRTRAERLVVGSRDRTRLVDGVLNQVAVVSEALEAE